MAARVTDPTWLRRRYLTDRAPVTDIAAEAGVDVSTLHRALVRLGIPARGRSATCWSDVLTEPVLRERVEAGMSLTEIGAALGCDRGTVRYWAARRGLAEGPSRQETAQLRRWYVREGLSVVQVAERLGVSRRAAGERLLAAGVELRGRGRPART